MVLLTFLFWCCAQGLWITDNIDDLVDGEASTSVLPLEALSVETWFTISESDLNYAGIIAVQQDGTGCVLP